MKIPKLKIRSIAQELGIRTPDVQLLLAQERFLARLMSHPHIAEIIGRMICL